MIRKWHSADMIFGLLEEYGVKKPLLVCDSSFPYLRLSEDFQNCPVPYVVFSQFTSNPLYEDVCKGVELFRKEGCDAVIAVGGGSSIDVAKCIKLYSTMNPEFCYLEQPLIQNHVLLIAVPTTAGTGSESTRYAVIYYQGAKQSVSSLAAIPDVAVLDADVLDTLPIYQKKCTMMDALCQGIESWWSVNSNEESRRLSQQAVRQILDAMEGYLKGNSKAAEVMLEAANLAGQAINITQTTAAHAMSYKITSLFGLPHGRAVAVCLPFVWKYMLEHPEKCADPRGWTYLENIFREIAGEIGCENIQEAPEKMYTMIHGLFRDEVTENFSMQELESLVRAVNPVRLKNSPVFFDETGIREVYGYILQNTMISK